MPRLSESSFGKIIAASDSTEAMKLFQRLEHAIYDFFPETQLLLGFPGDGNVSGYYSRNVSKTDVEFVQLFLEQENISALNTRLFKSDNDLDFTVLIASAQEAKASKEYLFKETKIIVSYTDFATEMGLVAGYLQKASEYSANDHQKKMMTAYVDSFQTGSIEAHKTSQKEWIQDIGPGIFS